MLACKVFKFAPSVAACIWLGLSMPALAAPPSPQAIARQAIADAQAIAPGGIDDLKAVEIGGTKQWIHVRGNSPDNPLLLFLHGGPGSPMMAESWAFQRPWEDFFTVVQWDQRGAGKTFSAARRKLDPAMSIERMQADAEELIQLLLRIYGKRKLFLLGHSWGSILGIKVAQHHPEWLYAYIGVGQVASTLRNETVGYELTLARARELHNEVAVKALEALAPYPRKGLGSGRQEDRRGAPMGRHLGRHALRPRPRQQ